VVRGHAGLGGHAGFFPDLIVFKELRLQGALGVDAPAYRAPSNCWSRAASIRRPARRIEPLDNASDLLATWRRGRRPPPVHAVLVPGAEAKPRLRCSPGGGEGRGPRGAGVPTTCRAQHFPRAARHPKLARAVHDLLATLLWNARLDVRLRELIIMRIGWVMGRSTSGQHWRVAVGLGCRTTTCWPCATASTKVRGRPSGRTHRTDEALAAAR